MAVRRAVQRWPPVGAVTGSVLRPAVGAVSGSVLPTRTVMPCRSISVHRALAVQSDPVGLSLTPFAPRNCRGGSLSAIPVIAGVAAAAAGGAAASSAADDDADDPRALCVAAARGDGPGVARQLATGADPNRRHPQGWCPLHCAAVNGHAEVCRCTSSQ